MARDVHNALETAFAILRLLDENDPEGKGMPTTEIAEKTGKHLSVFLRYRNALERLGLVEVVPEGQKNLVRLTDRGRCVARCLVS